MQIINGQKFLNIAVSDSDTYEIVYESAHTLNIFNYTSDTLIISEIADYSAVGNISSYIKLPPNGYVNSLSFNENTTFIKAFGSGDIGVVRTS